MDRREFLALGLGTHAIRARVAAITLCISCCYLVTHVYLGADGSFFVWAVLGGILVLWKSVWRITHGTPRAAIAAR